MRKLGLSLLLGSMVLVPYAAFSQEAAPSPDDYVCAFTGECAEEAAEEATDTPAQPGGEPRVSATRGFSLSTTRPKAGTPTRPTQRQTTRNRRQVAQRPANRPVAVQPGRVDLRLSFASGSAALSSGAQAQVRAFAEALKRPQLSDIRVRIEGHTDSSGGRALNMTLSQRRAQAVADFLMSQGIAASRLEVRGFGYDQPLPGRPASAGENRRVEAVRVS